MSTTMPKVNEINRKWYILDAAGKPLGRTAATAAQLLRGKHRPEFTPNIDIGDHVIIINAEKATLSGNKMTQKFYRKHSGWVGGLKEIRYDDLMEKDPAKAMTLAVNGMLPNTPQGRKIMTRCRVFRGAEHTHQAQMPEVWNK